MNIRKTTESDLKVFAPAHHDILEAEAMGIPPVLPEASECVTMDLNGFPLAIGGNRGDQVWFVTSDQVWTLSRTLKLQFHKCICQYRDAMLEVYPMIWNYVWVGNHPHIRFLKSIGAEFGEITRCGKFQLFVITRR